VYRGTRDEQKALEYFAVTSQTQEELTLVAVKNG
jgi:hypothetical protein